jgi:hydrogenase/urease accessory protein HupE
MSGPFLLIALAALGHNPDTSYARVEIGDRTVKTRLTYDIFTLLRITPLDDDGDRQVSRAELTKHLPQIEKSLREHIGVSLDGDLDEDDLGTANGFVWPPDTGDAIKQADFHAATGLIIFEFVKPTPHTPSEVSLRFYFFDLLNDRHTVLGVFALKGEMRKGEEYETVFSRFEPYFDYVTGAEPPPPAQPAEGQPALTQSTEPPRQQTRHTIAESMWRFFKMGVEHIFIGYDHICFLIALIVVSRFRDVVKIVTSFTVAHSITLILAALDVVRLNSRLVETCIAATIVYVAVENLWVKDTRHRWLLTFFFGLVHGFGFANVLREMHLPREGLIRCLLSFNVGVEVGQLAIATLLLPLAYGLKHWKYGPWAAKGISLGLAAFGLAWFIDRAFAIGFMPF